MGRSLLVRADWDAEASVWVATSPDLLGLVTEAPSIEALRAKLPGIAYDLLEGTDPIEWPTTIDIIARCNDRVTRVIEA